MAYHSDILRRVFRGSYFMRLVGTSCQPLEAAQLRSIAKISKLFGQESAGSIGGGLYSITFDPSKREIEARQLKSMKAGPHEAFWKMFSEKLDFISVAEVLKSSSLTAATAQDAAGKLGESTTEICVFSKMVGGAWLSNIRNRVNYDQSWATWYPYAQRDKYYDDLIRHINDWEFDPLEIDLGSHQGKDLRRFQATCNAVMALSRVVTEDMAHRCSAGKSFHDFGSLAFRRICRGVRTR